MNKWILLVLGLIFNLQLQAKGVEETLKQDGKIYVVVVVLCIIFLGLALYLFRIDRKVKKLEENED